MTDGHPPSQHLFIKVAASVLIKSQEHLTNAEAIQFVFENYQHNLCNKTRWRCGEGEREDLDICFRFRKQ
jgi:hypothetical protein